MSERRCPKCGSVYTDTGARFCPKDGSMLVEIQAKKPAAAPAPASGSGTGVRTPLPPGRAGLDRASSLSNQILDARYQVMKKLGEGGMSYVYLAKEISSGDTVAIKVLSPRLASDKSSVERLRREAGFFAWISTSMLPSFGQKRAPVSVYTDPHLGQRRSLIAGPNCGLRSWRDRGPDRPAR